ncbi:MAG TPA: zf-HC2 domain-containing protein [Tepidiformaceae bacterium]|nr:zf-HC2 domain-containing protein [Tepidiformaceae bacterium]
MVELITNYLENAQTAEDRARFERHISLCPNCATYLEQMRKTIAAVGRVSEEDIPAARREELVGLFRDWRNS